MILIGKEDHQIGFLSNEGTECIFQVDTIIKWINIFSLPNWTLFFYNTIRNYNDIRHKAVGYIAMSMCR